MPNLCEKSVKRCGRCKEDRPVSAFFKNRSQIDGLNGYCIPCAYAYKKEWALKNPAAHSATKKRWYEKGRERILIYQRKKTYDVSNDRFQEMLKNQNGLCAICLKEEQVKRRQLSVDHDHETGKIRELLCNNCNNGLGRFKDSLETLIRATEYLRKHKN